MNGKGTKTPPDSAKKTEPSPQLSFFESRVAAAKPTPAQPAPPADKPEAASEPPSAKPESPERAAKPETQQDRPAAKPEAAADEAKREPRVFAVCELVRAARLTLESRFADLRVEGEISGLKRSANGHLYFTLKDPEAQIDCVMYSRDATRLKFRVQDGQHVRCRGRLTLYEARGRFQFSVTAIEPVGAGALALAFEQLKQRLQAEGLFDSGRKRPLPFLPRRLGVVTSPQGAVIRDIIRVAHRRFPVPILLAPTPVQGEGAARSITAALAEIVKVPDVDVVIVARGGGSLEDLWAFNDEGLARAIAACPVPVISAVGHETDFTIADFVADLRAPTPSAAAELALPVASELMGEMNILCRRLARAVRTETHALRLRLERGRAALGDPHRTINARRQMLDDLMERAARSLHTADARRRADLRSIEGRLFRLHPQRRIADQRASLNALERRLSSVGGTLVSQRRRLLDALAGKMDALSPLKVLDRGYSLTRGPDGQVIRSVAGLAPNDKVTVTLRDGDLRTRIDEITSRR
jgi:exodeoxyribonuclease VII large subunit